MLVAGTKLGRYEILAAIGAGGMGEVYKANDTRLGRIVAIKQLKGGHTARFEQEARAIAALNHPNICALYDVGPDYLVMEHIEGKPLAGRFSPQEGVRLAIQIASALEEAHGRGILHRDLKPGNIMLTAKGSIKLLDFGLAKLTASVDHTFTMEGMAVGTAAYMSPEQALAKPLDASSDIFSFGAVLYEMLSGRPAFLRASSLDTLNAVVYHEPAPLLVPPALAEVVSRCLKKVPADRFPTMEDVRAALQDAGLADSRAHQCPSIAVLPFANMSRDAADEYFSDGLAEEIINLLARIPGLKVTARTSAFVFKGQNTDIRAIAKTLGVANLLEGSVRRFGNRIRVTVQLITAADGSNLWSERYDRELVDVFAVQDEISAAICAALQLNLSPHAAVRQRHTPKLPAYEALLKARRFHWKLTPESMAQAKEFYDQSIALDPQYALAQAYYADYLFVRTTLAMSSTRETAPAARALAQRALELDPSLPEAHTVLGVLAATYDYNWDEAAHRFRLAMADDTASPWCHMCCGEFYLLGSGRRKEAIEELERAIQADPLHLMHRTFIATCLAAVGQHKEAERHLRQAAELDPDFFVTYFVSATLYAAREMFIEALPFAEKGFALAPWDARSIGVYAGLLVRTGERSRGEQLVQRLGSGSAYGAPIGMAFYYSCSGEIDLAADWFEKAIEERDSMVVPFLQSGMGGPLRSSPRWPKLAALMNLPVAVGESAETETATRVEPRELR